MRKSDLNRGKNLVELSVGTILLTLVATALTVGTGFWYYLAQKQNDTIQLQIIQMWGIFLVAVILPLIWLITTIDTKRHTRQFGFRTTFSVMFKDILLLWIEYLIALVVVYLIGSFLWPMISDLLSTKQSQSMIYLYLGIFVLVISVAIALIGFLAHYFVVKHTKIKLR